MDTLKTLNDVITFIAHEQQAITDNSATDDDMFAWDVLMDLRIKLRAASVVATFAAACQQITVPSAAPLHHWQLTTTMSEADKQVPCTRDRTNHEWYVEHGKTHCRQCGIEVNEQLPSAAANRKLPTNMKPFPQAPMMPEPLHPLTEGLLKVVADLALEAVQPPAADTATAQGGPFGDGSTISTTHYQCPRCNEIVDAKISTTDHNRTCRNPLPELADLKDVHYQDYDKPADLAPSAAPVKATGYGPRLTKAQWAALETLDAAEKVWHHWSKFSGDAWLVKPQNYDGHSKFGRMTGITAKKLIDLKLATVERQSDWNYLTITEAGRTALTQPRLLQR